jgi:hypothetical protein
LDLSGLGSPSKPVSWPRSWYAHCRRRSALKRIGLFVATNIAVILLLSIVAQLLGVDRLLGQGGFWGLLIFAGLIASAAFIAGMAVKRVG